MEEVNTVGQMLTSLMAERVGIPEENLSAWWAEGDGADGVNLRFEITLTIPKDEFDEVLEQANSIVGGP